MTWTIQNLNGFPKTFKTNDSPEAIAWMSDRSVPEAKTRRVANSTPTKFTPSKALAPHQISDNYSTTEKVPSRQKIKHNRGHSRAIVIKF